MCQVSKITLCSKITHLAQMTVKPSWTTTDMLMNTTNQLYLHFIVQRSQWHIAIFNIRYHVLLTNLYAPI